MLDISDTLDASIPVKRGNTHLLTLVTEKSEGCANTASKKDAIRLRYEHCKRVLKPYQRKNNTRLLSYTPTSTKVNTNDKNNLIRKNAWYNPIQDFPSILLLLSQPRMTT